MVHGHTTYALRLEKDPAQPVWLLALVAVLGFGSGHPTFGALMAVLFVVALLRVGRTIGGAGFYRASLPGGDERCPLI